MIRTFKTLAMISAVSIAAIAAPAMAQCGNNGCNNGSSYNSDGSAGSSNCGNNGCNNGSGNNGGWSNGGNGRVDVGGVAAVLGINFLASTAHDVIVARTTGDQQRRTDAARTDGQIRVDDNRAAHAESFYLLQYRTQTGGGAPAGTGTAGGPQTDLNDCQRINGRVMCTVRQ